MKSFGFKDPIHREIESEQDSHTQSNDTKTSHIPQNTVPTVPPVPTSTKSGTNPNGSVPSVPENEVTKLDGKPEIQPQESQSDEECELPNLPEMPEQVEDDLDVVSEEELEPFKKPPEESFNPIISVRDFFSNDMPLNDHSLEESPCFPIINTRPGETSTDIIYYCKLHPELGSTFLTQVELHCRQKEPDIHRAEILRIEKGESA